MIESLSTNERDWAEYGARPVSVDLTRSQRLIRPSSPEPGPEVPPQARRLTRVQTFEQLALAHWPADHHIYVCSVAGGTGRTTVAGLIALTLAGLPYAHLHRPVGLGELDRMPLSRARSRWAGEATEVIPVTRDGGQVRLVDDDCPSSERRPVVVVDAAAGLRTVLRVTTADPAGSIVMLTRADRSSLAEAADALVWLRDQRQVSRGRITVVINYGTGPADRGTKPAATAVGIRCSSVHRLPAHPALGPGRVLPSHHAPAAVRKSLIGLCFDVYHSIQPAVTSTAPPEEDHDA